MPAKDKKSDGRVLLPDHVVPTKYDLHVTPNLTSFTFDGVVTIRMTTAESISDDNNAAKTITLHSKELLYHSAAYAVVGGQGDGEQPAAVVAEEISVNTKKTTVTFTFPEAIPPSSTIELKINYQGCLNNQMAGFYRSTYKDAFGKQKIVASTQFEALDARRAFPCVDEPAVKATFLLTMTVPANLECFSNMPEASRITMTSTTDGVTAPNGLVTISFLESPRMSTYLLAFCIGEFDYLQAQTAHGVLIRVYAPRGRSASAQFALDCGVRCLDTFDDFFGIPYPLPKLDMVAVPEFAMGAMENWGLVTYRDVDLLIDPMTASNSQKQRVCSVVCHEFAHQWFGNLVTMEWWNDLWLNEGFASWAENWASNELFPSYEMWNQYVAIAYAQALSLDGLKSSHPIQVPIAHAEEVEQVFDIISYRKGGSVVRMIKAVIGFNAFRKGLGQYMTDHAYGNTETADLWKAWENSSGMPVQELMSSWTEQMGFPILKITKEDWQADKAVFELEQSWFLADGSEIPEADKDKLWSIPLLTCTPAGPQADMVIMREKTCTLTVPLENAKDWVKLNAGHEVLMRVQCTQEMIDRLTGAISSKQLSTADRVGLVLDTYALVKAGAMGPEVLMKLLAAYADEDSSVVWQGLSGILTGLEQILSDNEELYEKFVPFARKLVMPLVDKIGWESKPNDEHLTGLLRGKMVSLLDTFCSDDTAVASEAKKRSEAFLADPTDVQSLPTDIKAPVFRIYLKNGGQAEYDNVKGYYPRAKDNAERLQVLQTLGSITDPKLKLATMDWTTSGEIALQDFFYAMGSVGSSKTGRDITWQYLKAHFHRIKAMLGKSSPSLMSAVIGSCAGGFCSADKADEIDAFFEENPLPHNSRRIAQLTENMRANAKFLEFLNKSGLSDDAFWSSLLP